ncbi:hypothetical protein H6F61_26485 [Cyanobacteria bacterium FACHB-472]|nr:hypothetical protein [Cyanobacteria bacterium FACHB-472]
MGINNDVALIPSLEDWQAPALQNGWVNTTTNYSPAGFYKDPFNIVHIRGIVSAGTTSLIFTLPLNYRPPTYRYLFNTVANSAIARIDIYTNGQVHLVAGSNVGLALDGILFRV